jgi:hypothetical protein
MTINFWLSEFVRTCLARLAGQSQDGTKLMKIKQARAIYERPHGRFELWEKHRKVVDSLAPHVQDSKCRTAAKPIEQSETKKKRTQTQQTIVLFKSNEEQSKIKARITHTRLESLESYLEKARAKA